MPRLKEIWTPRLKVGGVEVGIRGEATITDLDNDIDMNLKRHVVERQRLLLYSQASAVIEFGLGKEGLQVSGTLPRSKFFSPMLESSLSREVRLVHQVTLRILPNLLSSAKATRGWVKLVSTA
jgi:hypothetical protein